MGASGSSSLKVPDCETGKVYMFNFPSIVGCPSPSPYGLKLETWLRMKEIPHEVIRGTQFSSQKGQVPFIEYNGKEYNDSNLVIEFLTKEFGKEETLTDEQRGIATCIMRVIDNATLYSWAYYRFVECPKESMELMKFLSPMKRRIFSMGAPIMMRRRAADRGMGGASPQEIYERGFADIAALSTILGKKKFLMGGDMTTVDCTVFGHLAQIKYLPLLYPHKQFMEQHATNVCEYLDRVKEAVWPDWDDVCEQNLQKA